MFKKLFKYIGRTVGWIYRLISANQNSIYAALIEKIALDAAHDFLARNPKTVDQMRIVRAVIDALLQEEPGLSKVTAKRVAMSATTRILRQMKNDILIAGLSDSLKKLGGE